MFQILSNKQVLKKDVSDTFEQWIPIGMESRVQIVKAGNIIRFSWLTFDTNIGDWLLDAANTTPFNVQVNDQQFNQITTLDSSKWTPGNYVVKSIMSAVENAEITVTM